MKITEIRTPDELQSLSGEWDKLLGSRGEEVLTSNFFWASSWWSHHGTDAELRVLVFEDDNQIVGIAPLCARTLYRKNLAPVKVRCFIGDGLSDYGCLLARGDRGAICTEFLRQLKKSKDWHELRLHNIPGTSGDYERLCAAGTALGFRIDPLSCESRHCLYIPFVGEFKDYRNSLGRDLPHDVAKRQRRLNRAGGYEVKFTGDISFTTFLEAAAALHVKRQADLARPSFFDIEGEGAFVRDILTEYNRRGWLDYVAMIIKDQIAAYRLGFKYGGVTYDWNTAFDPQYNDFSVGKVLLYEWLEDLFRRPDVTEFNFMRGDSEFKRMYARESRPNNDFVVRHPRSLYARGITLAETIWRATKRRAQSPEAKSN